MILNSMIQLKKVLPNHHRVIFDNEPISLVLYGDVCKFSEYDSLGISQILASLGDNKVNIIEVEQVIYLYEEFGKVDFILPIPELHDFFLKKPSPRPSKI
ncbi:MAG: hypothetical protein ABJK37_07065 [Paraglaciecola sp.]|uniref:hypothetical protein n=1 Tax=Paraglaciecola sp. TaxID=1920173 RepID=UPI00329895D8